MVPSSKQVLSWAVVLSVAAGCRQEPRFLADDQALAPPPRIFRRLSPADATPRQGSAIALAREGARRLAFVADEEEDAIHTLDLQTGTEIARTPLAGRPTQILVGPSGDLLVALRGASALVHLGLEVEGEPLIETSRVRTADEPVALALSDDREVVWVASGIGRKLEGFALAGAAPDVIELPHEARSLLLSGRSAFVGYLAGPGGKNAAGGVGVVDLVAHAARFQRVFLPTLTIVSKPKMDPCTAFDDFGCSFSSSSTTIPARVARQSFALVQVDGRPGAKSSRPRVLAPLELVGPGEPLVLTGGYGGGVSFDPIVSEIVPLDAETGVPAPLLQRTGRRSEECRLPRAALFDPTTRTVAVACPGSGDVQVFGADEELPANDVKVRLPSKGVTALARDPEASTLIAFASFRRVVEVHRWPLGKDAPKVTIALSHVDGLGLSARAHAGRLLFHDARDARVSGDGRACASCHPDGRDDGLVWPTPNGPRQTFTLAGRVDRDGPFGWDAEHPTLAKHIAVTVKNLHGSGLPEEQREELAAYLRAIPAPVYAAVEPATEVSRGRDLFASDETGCSGCHSVESSFTDGMAHAVSSATKVDRKKTFVAPSLIGVAATAPYFHDGRYATLGELLRGCDGKMGETSQLSATDFAALEAYLRTL